jgi:hypothetical protein
MLSQVRDKRLLVEEKDFDLHKKCIADIHSELAFGREKENYALMNKETVKT